MYIMYLYGDSNVTKIKVINKKNRGYGSRPIAMSAVMSASSDKPMSHFVLLMHNIKLNCH